MLADSDRAKSYIGEDVILAVSPSRGDPWKVTIAVGELYEYAILSDIPFGTALLKGAAWFSVDIGADEYQCSIGSQTFPTQARLEQWASELPARQEFVVLSLPSEAHFAEIRNVIAIAKLEPELKEAYFKVANELLYYHQEDESADSTS